jgi:DNA-binding protein YbaB
METKISAGQDKMENSMSSIQENISAGQDKVENSISAIQAKISAISAIISGQAEFEKKITDKLDKQLKGLVIVVE